MSQILIIDDDSHINDMLSEALQNEGYTVSRAYSGTEAAMLLSGLRPDLILLDLMLPGLSGEELLPTIKDIPVIVISAKCDISDKVEMLTVGASDYITKPFDMRELLARIAVQLRRKNNDRTDIIEAGGITLYIDRLTAIINDTEIRLTRTECAILKLLMLNAGSPIGKTTILEKISYDTPDCTERSLKQHISNIRHKLGEASGKDHIESVYGIGFRLIT
ncbi:MAG: response regulator transcription factor [Lachnospiraceae bacterium]|nr:response regulator transcription factor [Lachnospiraceae bacterium]